MTLGREAIRAFFAGVTATGRKFEAEILGVGRPALSAVLNGHTSLSPEMAIRVEKAFSVSMDLLLKMQLQFDIARARRTAKSIKVQRFKPAA